METQIDEIILRRDISKYALIETSYLMLYQLENYYFSSKMMKQYKKINKQRLDPDTFLKNVIELSDFHYNLSIELESNGIVNFSSDSKF